MKKRGWGVLILPVRKLTGAASVAICLILSMLMAGTVFVSADTDPQAAGAGQTQKTDENAERLMITEAGTYTLTGTMKGTVYVDPGEGDVTLILDNADIEGIKEPAVMAVSGDSLTIELTECSYNRLADKPDNAEGAAVVSRVRTVFRGCGCLQAEGNRQYGIQTEGADLTFESGKYLLLSEEAGISMNGPEAGTLYLRGGCVFINAKQKPYIAAEQMEKSAGMLEETVKTDVRSIDCCHEGKCMGCCCDRKCRQTAVVNEDEDDDDDEDDDECDCRESAVDSPGPVVEGTVTNAAVPLQKEEQAVSILFEEDAQHVGISEPGTYYIAGSSANGSITVRENTKGVVLVLGDLDLTNASGAALTIGSSAVVKIIVEGNVYLADSPAPDPGDSVPAEESAPDPGDNVPAGESAPDPGDSVPAGETAPVSGAVLRGGAGSEICITGDGTLHINGETGDGIAMDESSSLVIDGDVDMEIQAATDGIYSENDVAVLQGDLTIQAGSSGVQAEHVLTIGEQGEQGPEIQITNSYDGISAEVVNINSGSVDLDVEEDGIDSESVKGDTDASVNMTGGELHIQAEESGIDSDGNVNLIGGTAVIESKEDDGTCSCVDVDGNLYISDEFSLDCGCGEDKEES